MPLPVPVPVTFEDVAVYLSRAEWEAISEEQQELYRSVMLDVCELLRSLGIQAEPPLGTEHEMFGGHHPGSRQEEVSQQPTDREWGWGGTQPGGPNAWQAVGAGGLCAGCPCPWLLVPCRCLL
ncbi:zinc finger protein 517-like [Dryobates pubescens]|uniref:zinc finger protein 517-like n=1 Tax=Dryobates pubescens TaxID=118200 RepID=UPI0023B8C691|nr:zinc finger protein 517-like [Dryobates pubescens]